MLQAGKIPRKLLKLGLFAGFLFLGSAMYAVAQERAEEKAAPDNLGPWKLVNTGIFAVGLAWFLTKYGPRFFNARSADIQKAIRDATGLKMEADFRYSEIDRKMASLADEVRKIREQANVEMEREHDRIRRQTEEEIEHIHKNAANEIDALRKEAAERVQLHTAELALGLAERRIRDRFSEGEPAYFIDDFIRLIERGKN